MDPLHATTHGAYLLVFRIGAGSQLHLQEALLRCEALQASQRVAQLRHHGTVSTCLGLAELLLQRHNGLLAVVVLLAVLSASGLGGGSNGPRCGSCSWCRRARRALLLSHARELLTKMHRLLHGFISPLLCLP